jgi:hypothetical protein
VLGAGWSHRNSQLVWSIQQDVFGLQVAVHDAFGGQGAECHQQLASNALDGGHLKAPEQVATYMLQSTPPRQQCWGQLKD